ncbi:MAG TPA: ATP-binding protein [Thermodesulfobacteriota bacterium]|nr:ATP-binding protein [Thermodesulfobacteriota bacterium]
MIASKLSYDVVKFLADEVGLFSEMDEEEISCEINGDIIELKQGEMLFSEGDEARYFFVILEGTIQAYRVINGQKLPITNFAKGMTGGEVPLLAGTPHLANGVALTDAKLLLLSEEFFWSMIGNCGTVRKKILADMAERMQQLQLLSYQREKLISLGTMAAGLAHELNNPASAARRTAENLTKTLQEFDIHSSEMLKWVMLRDDVNKDGFPFQSLVDILRIDRVKLDSLEKSDLEDELANWLQEYGVEDPWNVASTLVSVGYTKENLADFFLKKVVAEHIANGLNWLYKDVEMRLLSSELKQSTTRISELVTAMKSYSYMDQVLEKSKIDLHEGIDNTVIILGHKLKKKKIKLIKEYGENIPKISAYGSELNQVWTNLIDNAIDVLPHEGTITIRTYLEQNDHDMVAVEVIDNGPGIPREIQHRIFEPFFTTKRVGEGTGLGLEISNRIVVNQHRGSINLFSEPGFTRFKVTLPVDL